MRTALIFRDNFLDTVRLTFNKLENRVALVLSTLVLILSIQNQKLYIITSHYKTDYKAFLAFFVKLALAKMIAVTAIFFISRALIAFILKIRSKGFNDVDKLYLFLFTWFSVWFSFWLVGQYPGFLIQDSFATLSDIMYMSFTNWFSFIHPLLYLSLFQIFPHPIIIPVFQVLLTAYVFSLILTNLYRKKTPVFLLTVFVLGISLSIPIITNTIFYTRDTVFGMVHLLLGYFVFDILIGEYQLTVKKIITICLITVFLALYRGDSAPLLLLVPLVILAGKKIKWRLFAQWVSASVILFLGLNFFMPILLHSNSPGNYKLSLVLNPLGYLLTHNYYTPSPQTDLNIMKDLIDVEQVKALSTPYEIPAYWANAWNSNKSDQEYQKLYSLYRKMILNNIPLFLVNRVLTFGASTGLSPDGSYFEDLARNEGGSNLKKAQDLFRLKHKVSENLYSWQNKLLVNSTVYSGAFKGRFIYWSFLPQLFILILACILYKWIPATSLSSLIILCRVPLVFLAAPASQFKYYYSVYLFGIVAILAAVAELRTKSRTTFGSDLNNESVN